MCCWRQEQWRWLQCEHLYVVKIHCNRSFFKNLQQVNTQKTITVFFHMEFNAVASMLVYLHCMYCLQLTSHLNYNDKSSAKSTGTILDKCIHHFNSYIYVNVWGLIKYFLLHADNALSMIFGGRMLGIWWSTVGIMVASTQ